MLARHSIAHDISLPWLHILGLKTCDRPPSEPGPLQAYLKPSSSSWCVFPYNVDRRGHRLSMIHVARQRLRSCLLLLCIALTGAGLVSRGSLTMPLSKYKVARAVGQASSARSSDVGDNSRDSADSCAVVANHAQLGLFFNRVRKAGSTNVEVGEMNCFSS